MNNTKNISFTDNFFNFKLYLQGLKRLRLTGLVSLICLSLLSVLIIVSEYIDYKSYIDDELLSRSYFVDSASYYGLLFCVLYLIVPLMTLIIFHYLSTRNGSDFYHAVASKRRAVFFSFLAAVITWAFIIIAGYTIITTLMFIIMSDLYVINIPSILIFSLNLLISCILVAAVFAIGCSLTGTTFSNVVVSTGILFFPRVLITLLCAFLSMGNELVNMGNMALLTQYRCNMPAGLLIGFFGEIYTSGYELEEIIYSLGFQTVYTLLLAMIYIFIGSIIYTKRPSEAAGKPASSKKIQFIILLIIGYCISLIAVATIYSFIQYDYQADFEDYILLGTICAFTFFGSFVAIFIYNLITSKSLKSSLKAMLSYPVIIALDAITIAIMLFADWSIYNYQPAASDIDYIRIESVNDNDIMNALLNDDEYKTLIKRYHSEYDEYYDDYDYDDYYYFDGYYYDPYNYSLSEYFGKNINDIKITDPEIIELITDSLSTYISNLEAENNGDSHSFDSYYTNVTGEYMNIVFGDGLDEVYRTVLLPRSTYLKLMEAFLNSSNKQDLLSSLPEADDSGVYLMNSELTDTQIKTVYSAYLDDLKNLDIKQFYMMANYSNVIGYIELNNYINGILTFSELPVTPSTPTAYGLYVKYINEKNVANHMALLDMLSNDSTRELNSHLTLEYYDYTITDNVSMQTVSRLNAYEALDDELIDILAEVYDLSKKFYNSSSYDTIENFDQKKYDLIRVNTIVYKAITEDKDEPFYEDEYYYEDYYDSDLDYYSGSYNEVYGHSSFYLLVDKEDPSYSLLIQLFDGIDSQYYIAN